MTVKKPWKVPIGFVLSLGAVFLLAATSAFAISTADVGVTKSNDTGGTLIAGQTVTYTITLHNFGPNGANKVDISDTLNSALTNIQASATNPDQCSVVAQVVTCEVQGIGNGGNDVVTITATVDPATPKDTVITNCASITGSHSEDDNSDNDTGCDGNGFTVVECPVDLTITKACQTFCPPSVGVARSSVIDECTPTDIVDPIPGGSDFTYFITVTNNGTGTAHNVLLDEGLVGVTFQDVSPNPCTSGAIGTNDCNLGDIASTGSVSFRIHVTATDSGPINNTASVSADENCDKNPEDNSASCGVTVETNNMPTALEADRESSSTDTLCETVTPTSTSSDVNRVFEPGESVRIDPTWHNNLSNADADTTGTADTPSSPSGGTLAIEDCSADYGAIPANSDSDCNSATGDCYQMLVTEDVVGVRPHLSDHPRHWDTTFKETLSSGETHTWTLHIGDTFTDVPRSDGFYRFIETILHNRITIGCQNGNFFCPAAPVVRAQIAAFIARSLAGNDSLVPTSGTGWDCSTGPSQFTDVPITSQFCKHVNYLKDQKVIFGCTGTTFCPQTPASRGQIGIAVARAAEVKLGNTADPDGSIPLFGNDDVAGPAHRAYNCDSTAHTDTLTLASIPAGTPPFTDVPSSGDVCKSVGLLFVNHVVDGFGDGTYHPAANIRRDQAAKILVNEFVSLPLYGPLTF